MSPAGGPASENSAGRFGRLHLALVGASLFSLLNTGAFTGIIPYCVAELGQHQSHGAWMNGEFFAAQALGMLLANPFAARIGALRLFLWAGWATALGAFLCAAAPGFVFFLLARILLGAGGGVLILLSQLLLFDEYRPSLRPLAPLLWAVIAIVPFALGPLFGGWLEEWWGREEASWRLWFLLDGIVLFLCTVEVRRLLVPRPPTRPESSFDWIGFGLLAAALFSLQTALDMGDDYDWYNSSLLNGLVGVALLAFTAFLGWELQAREPLVKATLFLRPTFTVGMVCLCGGFLLFYGLWSLLLVRLQSVWGYGPWLGGLVMLSLAVGAFPSSLWSARAVTWRQNRFLLAGSLLLFAGFAFWTSYYNIHHRRNLWLEFAGPQLLEGIGLGIFLAPATNFLSQGLSPKNQAMAIEIAGSFRVAAQGWASLLLGTILYRQAAFHKRRLVEWLPSSHPLFDELHAGLRGEGIGWDLGLRLLDREALAQTQVLAFEDLFRVAAWGFLLLAALVLLCPAPAASRNGESPGTERREREEGS
ncbi:Multidrug export protein EmrB [Methylacidimicrobium cyclopophantes]|uniref:Multidrug export protein EmrB n=1 Tax=Methylacidimicrobium cyclopophantes TaxID=1041766 RepID=A0A5E6MKH6_9BACT|nr:MFS transporter [Methylacidimicrobium cyclopophantes]VVM06003.1 Multidrug export protein EmrB [Methylacidimicrobium cyclopophantes]